MRRQPPRLLFLASGVGITGLFLVGGFFLGRALVGGDDASPAAAEGAEAAPTVSAPDEGAEGVRPSPPPAVPVAPTVGGVDPVTGLPLDPDRTKPFWAVPYRQAEAMLPFFEGKLAGVTIKTAGNPALQVMRRCPPGGHSEDVAASQRDDGCGKAGGRGRAVPPPHRLGSRGGGRLPGRRRHRHPLGRPPAR
uniref:Uncharacterized protein n=1 Tax=uncultured prokaryote TaxID=198431 RepID=H5SPJ6_9ZZZZ|nr:hypothetical protein HGMM_F54D01C09 [uncultured prokaryote]